MDSFFKLLDDLIRPGNGLFLAAFIVVLLLSGIALAFLVAAFIGKDKLNFSHQFGPLWIHLSGGDGDSKAVKSGYRKLLYVKVNLLSNRTTHPTPFYTRTVERLGPSDCAVPVYDEAVFYTLKLFPQTRPEAHERDTSHGIVDARLVIPWLTTLASRTDEGAKDPHSFDMEAAVPSDTMCSVSHFINALQGPTQSFCTLADEDAESLRLVVDFSSIPNATDRVHFIRPRLMNGQVVVETDDLKFEPCTDTVFMAHCKNAKKGYVLRMDFTFNNWDAPPA
jgi:hypothetical protein